jgi:phosphatidate cytidylyltransferase
MLFGFIVEKIDPSITANLWIFALAGLFVSAVAQVGDLSMSVIKRTYGIKDYGKLFPGHVGILDRFDSVIAVSVVLLVFTTFFSFFKVM